MSTWVMIVTSIMSPVIMLIGLTYFVVTDKYILKRHKTIMLGALTLLTTLLLSDVIDFYLTYYYAFPALRLLNCTYGYMAYPTLIVLFYHFVSEKRRFMPAWIICCVNGLVYAVSLFTGIAFTINENNVFVRGPLGFTCHIICVLLLLNLLFLTYREFKGRKRFFVVPLLCLLLLLGAMVLDMVLPGADRFLLSFVALAIVICCVFFYIWIHFQLAEQYEERLIEQQRMRIMVSQIQPHFLYNTIATFKALCRSNPDKAAMVAEKFGKYLRDNLDSLSEEELIPVNKELEHTRVYAEIEMVRFENIHVVYDIDDEDFLIPTLTIQPIVENAIRHGVRIREEGIVRVCTCNHDGFHEVIISDNGKGFDISNIESGNGTHIGIRNVRERIERLCGGTMTIESAINGGTTVTIRIPETGKEE